MTLLQHESIGRILKKKIRITRIYAPPKIRMVMNMYLLCPDQCPSHLHNDNESLTIVMIVVNDRCPNDLPKTIRSHISFEDHNEQNNIRSQILIETLTSNELDFKIFVNQATSNELDLIFK
jgi:hypothetical protein